MAQWVKVLPAKSDGMSLVLGIPMVTKELIPERCFLTSTFTLWHTSTATHTHIQKKNVSLKERHEVKSMGMITTKGIHAIIRRILSRRKNSRSERALRRK